MADPARSPLNRTPPPRMHQDWSRALEIRVTSGGVDVFGSHLSAVPEGPDKSVTKDPSAYAIKSK